MKLRADEGELIGGWVQRDGQMQPDEVCGQIEALVAGPLERVAADASGWSTLYRDPADGRMWEHTFPHSEMHGGGPPRLTVANPEEIRARYGLYPTAHPAEDG